MIETTLTLQWFAVDERLPDNSCSHLLRFKDGGLYLGWYECQSFAWRCEDTYLEGVTHWAALPVLGPEVFAEDLEALFLEWVAERQARRKEEGNAP